MKFYAVESEFKNGLCVETYKNNNFSVPQKKLITWHLKLGIALTWIQDMMRWYKIEDSLVNILIMHPIVNTKFCSTTKCAIPLYDMCQISLSKKQSLKTIKQKTVAKKYGILYRDKYKPGGFYLLVNSPLKLLINCQVGMSERY